MPPIRKLEDAFLSQLLEEDMDINVNVLDSNIDSASLSIILKKLDTTSNALQQEIFNKVDKNFDEFSSLYNKSQSLHWKILDLVKNVSDTESATHDSSTQVQSTIDAYKQVVLESENNQAKINTLENIEELLKKLEATKVLLKQFDYLKVVNDLSQLSKSLEEWTKGDTRIIGYLKDHIEQNKQALILQLQDDLNSAIQFNVGSIRILETIQPLPDSQNSVHIKNVLKSLYQLNVLPEELARVKNLIFKNIFYPYFDNVSSTLQFNEVEVGPLSKGGVFQVIKRTTNSEDMFMDPIEMLQQVDSMIGFFYRYMFDDKEDKELKRLFGNLLSPELFELMINRSIMHAIPSSKEHLVDFESVVDAVTTFENRCRDIYGFALNDDVNSLGAYVSKIDKHYAKKRCERILLQGRNMMIRKLYDTETVHVPEADGHTYRYQITQTPKVLLVLVSDTLSEAADLLESHPISAFTLIKGLQDLLDMYRAIMPSFHRSQYLSSAANSLIFRNDCIWLSNRILSDIVNRQEVKQFRNCGRDLEESSKRLEELGKAWHELTLTQCMQLIQRAIEPLDGFSGMSENTKFQQDCDRCITQAIEVVKSFASNTRQVVDENTFLDMLGRIVDHLLTGFINDIEGLVDIGAEESHIVARSLNSFAQLVEAFDLPGKDATESFVIDLVPNWEKFWLVKDILEMNMREIMEFYRDGKLHMFEKSELVGLLCSLFADTDLRESNIEEIKSGRSAQVTMDRSLPSTTNVPTAAVSKITEPATATTAATTRAAAATATATATSIIPSSAPTSSVSLDYQLDDDMELGDGWGNDEEEDLFANTDVPATTAPPANHVLDYNPDKEGEIGEGWGIDDDDDLFGTEESSVNHVLEYKPDEGEVAEGWDENEDDLFAD